MSIRIGLGHDTHRLGVGKPLMIGGIEIPHHLGPVAHSDGDVLLHALIDAILGALAWGDIGEWFPDTDPAYKGADSSDLLDQVIQKVKAEGWRISNTDCIVFAQRPKLSEYKQSITDHIAKLLLIESSQVNVKATTGEKVGPVGRQEAICAEVVILMQRD